MLEILNPNTEDTPRLRELWRDSFNEDEGFLNLFFSVEFSPDHTLILKKYGKIVSALYIIDCEFKGQKIGYIYAVATDKAERSQGFATKLLDYSCEYLKTLGYSAAALRPASESLFDFYKKLGFDVLLEKARFETIAYGSCDVRKITAEEYTALRSSLLPEKAIIQNASSLSLLKDMSLYAGNGFLLAAEEKNSKLFGAEFLGDRRKAPAVTASLGYPIGVFESCGSGIPFALLKNFSLAEIPDYFGFSLE